MRTFLYRILNSLPSSYILKCGFLILLVFVSLFLSQCDKDDNSIDEYVTAIVDGKEYNAEWRMTRKFTEDGADWLQVLSANSNPELASTNPDFLEISFSLIDDCLKPGIYNYEFIQDESGMGNFIPF